MIMLRENHPSRPSWSNAATMTKKIIKSNKIPFFEWKNCSKSKRYNFGKAHWDENCKRKRLLNFDYSFGKCRGYPAHHGILSVQCNRKIVLQSLSSNILEWSTAIKAFILSIAVIKGSFPVDGRRNPRRTKCDLLWFNHSAIKGSNKIRIREGKYQMCWLWIQYQERCVESKSMRAFDLMCRGLMSG